MVYILSLTIEMTSKCSKLCSETTCLWLVIPLPLSPCTWHSQKPGLVQGGWGGGNGCQYTWFLFPEIPICQTIVHAYPKLLASPDKQKCAAFFLTSMVRKVSTLKLMGHSILIFGNACSYPFKIPRKKQNWIWIL